MKIIRKIALVSLLSVLGLVTFIAASIFFDGWIGSRRLDSITNVTVANPGGPAVRAYLARPAGAGPHPTVIMIHEFWGFNTEMRDKADLLARSGYVVVAPDMFRGSSTSWIPRAIYQTLTTPQERRNTDLDAVYAWLEQQPEVDPGRVAVMGFCFGGATSLRYSLWNPKLAATAVFYGSPISDANQLKSLPGPLLGVFGGADSSIPLAEVGAFESALVTAGIPSTITIYPDQPHAFITDVAAIEAGGAPGAAWAQLLGFLDSALRTAPQAARPLHTPRVVAEAGLGYYVRLAFAHTLTGHGTHR
ncbi:dienelactone hydrolase [Anaerolineae bacterium]|nr:dienelactone hydrolase [Anaerolineae bacterium]